MIQRLLVDSRVSSESIVHFYDDTGISRFSDYEISDGD